MKNRNLNVSDLVRIGADTLMQHFFWNDFSFKSDKKNFE